LKQNCEFVFPFLYDILFLLLFFMSALRYRIMCNFCKTIREPIALLQKNHQEQRYIRFNNKESIKKPFFLHFRGKDNLKCFSFEQRNITCCRHNLTYLTDMAANKHKKAKTKYVLENVCKTNDSSKNSFRGFQNKNPVGIMA